LLQGEHSRGKEKQGAAPKKVTTEGGGESHKPKAIPCVPFREFKKEIRGSSEAISGEEKLPQAKKFGAKEPRPKTRLDRIIPKGKG